MDSLGDRAKVDALADIIPMKRLGLRGKWRKLRSGCCRRGPPTLPGRCSTWREGAEMSRAATLRNLISGTEIVSAPGAYDTLTARLVERAGFPAIYMTGFGATVAGWVCRTWAS